MTSPSASAGKRSRLVRVEKFGQVTDPAGQPVRDAAGQLMKGWSLHAKIWVNVANQSGLETIKADAPVSAVRASIRLRYREDITDQMRVVVKGRQYKIIALLPDDQRREHLDLVCELVRPA